MTDFVRTGLEITTAAGDFQADDEGSIPFTRSNVFNGLVPAAVTGAKLVAAPLGHGRACHGHPDNRALCHPDRDRRDKPGDDATRFCSSLLNKFSDIAEKIRAVHVAFGIHRHAFRQARAAGVWIWTCVRDEILDGSVRGAADANAALRALVKAVTGLRQRQLSGVGPAVPRFGVGHIDHVVVVDVHAAWPAKLEPLGNESAVLVKNLDAVVLTVADEQPAAGIESQGMNDIELAWAHPFLSPCLEELSVFVELHDPRVTGAGAAA